MELQALFNDDDDDDEEAQQRRARRSSPSWATSTTARPPLLDKIRSANVVAGEAGGITQHIGAYQVERDGHEITFIDTPGHAAFTKMRARGAQVTDIVVLVVAADDGVMPQTVEAINHAKAAEVPIVVAVNKIDKENADPQRVLTQLAEQGLVPESWGGDTIIVEMSAQQNLGVDDLLDQLLVVAELEELTANPTGRAKGVVLEANLDVGRGPVATILVDKGLLKTGDPIVAGAAWGKVRAMLDDQGNQIKEAGPSTPVQVLGLSVVPNAGDEFRAAPDEKTARTVAEAREQRARVKNQRADARVQKGVKLEDIFTQIQKGEVATLNLVLKADVQGSLEALTESLRKLERDDVRPVFVHRAVGGITENDITLAATTNATIIGFNVRPDRKARELAETENVEIRTYEIIYQIIEDIERAMVGLLAPEYEEVVTGEAEVREIFRVPRVGAIAGCYVRSGVITRGSQGALPAGRRHHLEGQHHVAQALQGRRPRGAGGLRVRHRPLRLPGPQAGRPHRDLRRPRDREDVVAVTRSLRSLRSCELIRRPPAGPVLGRPTGGAGSADGGGTAGAVPPHPLEQVTAMHVLAYDIELYVPGSHSLKDKRQVVSSLLDGARRRFGVSAAEVEHQDQWQRARLGFAVVASSAGLATEIMDKVDRFIWSHPEIDVLTTERRWLE